MIAPLARLIDGLSVQKNFMRMPSIDERTLRLEEALQFLKGPGLHPRRKPAGAPLSDTRLWTERALCARRKFCLFWSSGTTFYIRKTSRDLRALT
jgi:hypothetical protein